MIKTKIIATLGPGCDDPRTMRGLVEAGVDVFRLNFSHGTQADHGRRLDAVRAACAELGATAAVMADLCGPKIRAGKIAGGGFDIAIGDSLDIVAGDIVGSPQRISTNRHQLVHEVQAGHRILIDDGFVLLRVREAGKDRLSCTCEVAGRISDHKGINLPDSDIAVSALTDKDRADAAWALDHGVDFIALSFVRSAADIAELRSLIGAQSACRVVAKIETSHAIDRLDEIIDAADVILVARGDLGVEMDLACVPLLQKDMSRRSRMAAKPVIIATQMLQSMVQRPTPTRAEVSDVANAILDSADAVMLSAETAIGPYPVEAVHVMTRVAQETEAFLVHSAVDTQVTPAAMRRVTTAVAHGASVLARELNARLVAVWTETGNTARLLSKHRIGATIVGLSPDEAVCRRMSMYYGVQPVRLDRNPSVAAMLKEVDEVLLEQRLAIVGDLIVVIAGTHLEDPGATNLLMIHLVGGQAH